jgi:glutaredoxin
MVAKINLYQFETCPFCAKVRAKLEKLGFKYEKVNVSYDKESEERKNLLEKSKVSTVPVIEIDGEFTGDSEMIIKKLEGMKPGEPKVYSETFSTKILTRSKND